MYQGMILNKYNSIISHKYSRLMRLDRPIPIALAVSPALWAVAFASKSWAQIIIYSIIVILGAIVARSAGCILNDIADRHLDSKVERTKNRPLASGEISLKEAYIILAILGTIGIGMLATLPLIALVVGILFIPLIAIYPYMKRVTYYPQVFLGFVYPAGAIIGWLAVSPKFSVIQASLYIASILWVVGFDTIYGHQDKADDEKIGIKSLSIKLGDKTQSVVWSLYRIMMIFIAVIGLNCHMNFLFYGVMALALYYLYWQTATLDINNPADCKEKFESNLHIGLIIWVGILIGRLF